MYETFFQLTHRPFAAAPAAQRYIPTNSLEQARAALARVVERAEGPGLLVGPAGTGKSLLCHLLVQQFRGRFLVALLASARLGTRRALLQNILFELKLPYRELDESELRLSLVDHLEPRSAGGDGLVLIIDEAQTLPLRLWEEIRLITNLVRDGQPRVRLVMAGNMAMEERLANPKLESLNQRIAARCYLQPMGRDETIYYIQEQVKRSGGDASQLFTESALRAIHTASDGIPRLVNQVCDHALLLAALGGHRQLDADGIEEAWADLQQLPAPWHEAPRSGVDGNTEAAKPGPGNHTVEFGQLDEPTSNSATVVGPFRSAEGDSATKQLETIDLGLSALNEDGAEFAQESLPQEGESGDFSPANESATEVELIFHSAHDPFGGGWEEEEVVIDRYTELEDARLRRVASDEGRTIAAALDAPEPPRPRLADTPSDDPAESRVAVVEVETAAPFDPASDPLLPEEPVAPVPMRATTLSLRDLAGDDRDMIVVEGEPPPAPPPSSTTPPKRKEYRQLFSTLRKR